MKVSKAPYSTIKCGSWKKKKILIELFESIIDLIVVYRVELRNLFMGFSDLIGLLLCFCCGKFSSTNINGRKED